MVVSAEMSEESGNECGNDNGGRRRDRGSLLLGKAGCGERLVIATWLEHSRPLVSVCAGMDTTCPGVDSCAGMNSACFLLPVEQLKVGKLVGSSAAVAYGGNCPASGPIGFASDHGLRQPPCVRLQNFIQSVTLVLGRDYL